jgi:hypothetical protein
VNYVHVCEPHLKPVTPQDNHNFSKQSRIRLIELGWSVTDLAVKIKRPRETVSRAINTGRFPHVRKQVANRLKINLPDAA